MNIVFKPPVVSMKKDKEKILDLWFWIFIFLVILFVFFKLVVFNKIIDVKVSNEVHKALVLEIPEPSVIQLVADSYGVPFSYMEKLSDYLSINKSRFGGIGLFSVRQEDLTWIQDKVLLETSIDLTNDMQNAQVAAYLLRRFHEQGYSWHESFLIYTFGFPAIHERAKYEDFISFIGFN